jgi:hypothetical protein
MSPLSCASSSVTDIVRHPGVRLRELGLESFLTVNRAVALFRTAGGLRQSLESASNAYCTGILVSEGFVSNFGEPHNWGNQCRNL